MEKGNFTIRPVKPSDAQGLNNIRRMKSVMRNIGSNPAETLSFTEKYILDAPQNRYMFVASLDEPADETVVGSVSLTIQTSPRKNHMGEIGIMVHEDYQSMGVGSKLMKAVLDLADNFFMLTRLELNVFCDNEKALGLYKKFGFEIEGTMRKAIKREGKYCDLYTMARIK